MELKPEVCCDSFVFKPSMLLSTLLVFLFSSLLCVALPLADQGKVFLLKSTLWVFPKESTYFNFIICFHNESGVCCIDEFDKMAKNNQDGEFGMSNLTMTLSRSWSHLLL